jgi:hypothetical protein
MTSPWLHIPLEDYEGHMSLPAVDQAPMLAQELQRAIQRHSPGSIAVICCAGGNGLDQIDPPQIRRIVVLDINPAYIEALGVRHASRLPGLELHCADVQSESLRFEPVDLIYAALLFEYVDVTAALASMKRHCRIGGKLVTLLQLPHPEQQAVSPSPYKSLNLLALVMKLIAPADVLRLAAAVGFDVVDSESIELSSGKQFSLQTFRA